MKLVDAIALIMLFGYIILGVICIAELLGGDLTLGDIGDFLTGAGACLTVLVAYRGLRIWRLEQESDVAKRLAIQAFELRRLIHKVRAPNLTAVEYQCIDLSKADTGDGPPRIPEVDTKIRAIRLTAAYNYWESMGPTIAEAELRWKKEVRSHFLHPLGIIQELSNKNFELDRIKNLQDQDRRILRTLGTSSSGPSDNGTQIFIDMTEVDERIRSSYAPMDERTSYLIQYTRTEDEVAKRIEASFKPILALLKSKI